MDLPGKYEYSTNPDNSTYSCTFGLSQTTKPSNLIGRGDKSVTEIIKDIKSHQSSPLSYNNWNQPADEIAASPYTYTIYEGTDLTGVVQVDLDG